MTEIGPFDSRVFWGTLYGTPLAWTLLLALGMLRLKFEYLPVIIAAVSMNGANLIGYYKCSGDAQGKMKNLLARGKAINMMSSGGTGIAGWLFSTLMSFIVPSSAPAASSSASNGSNSRTAIV